MISERMPRISALAAYLLGPFLVVLTTIGLLGAQKLVERIDHQPEHAYAIGFVLPIAVMALLAGRKLGYYTVGLSVAATILVLSPRALTAQGAMADRVEIVFLVIVGLLMTLGLDALRRNVDALEDAADARARLNTVMDTAPVGVLLSDLTGRLTYANQEAQRIWGREFTPATPAEYGKFGVHDATGAPTPPGETGLSRALRGEPGVIHREVIIDRPDRTRLWVDSRSTLVRSEDGRAIAAVSVFSDMTERKHTEDILRTRVLHEATLNKINDALLTSFEDSAIQSVACNALAEALNVDRCYFTLYTGEDSAEIPEDFRADGLPALAGSYRLSDFGIAKESIFKSRRSWVVRDTLTETDMSDSFRAICREHKLRSFVKVPLYDGGELAAVLSVVMADEPRDWQPREVSLCEAVLAATRTAVEAAQLRKREQRAAELLQKALLPDVDNTLIGLDVETYYQAALSEAALGGDFYDVFVAEKNCYALVVGDVSGKGLLAASQVAMVRNMLRYALYEGTTLKGAIARLNNALTEHNLLTGFVTLFVGLVDLGAKNLTYVSAGHEPTMIRRNSDGRIDLLETTGPPVGVVDHAEYEERIVPLGPGDTVFCYTDGLTDAGADRRHPLGVEGVAELFDRCARNASASEIVRCMVAWAREATPNGFTDDVCLLAASVKSPDALDSATSRDASG